MNFQQVEAANGQNITMWGVLTEVGGMQYTPQQKPKAVCKIRDDLGVIHTVHIHQGTGQLPQPAQYNQRCQFSLATFQGSYQNKPYTGYSGFWNAKAQVNQASVPSGQQASPVAPQSPNVPQPVPQSNKDASICRQTAGKVVAEALGNNVIVIDPDIQDLPLFIINNAEPIAEWFLTGKKPPLHIPQKVTGEQNDVPF